MVLTGSWWGPLEAIWSIGWLRYGVIIAMSCTLRVTIPADASGNLSTQFATEESTEHPA